MCDEMMEEFNKLGLDASKFIIEQAKEKYGQLTVYMTVPRSVQDIIDKYSVISENVCICCGRPNVPMLNTRWICPECKECFEKMNYKRCYEEFVPEDKADWNISRKMRWRQFSNDGWVDREKDISDTVDKVIAEWNRRHPNELV